MSDDSILYIEIVGNICLNISLYPPAIHGIIISPIIIHQPQFAIPHLAAPLDGLGNVTGGSYLTEGGIGVGGGDITVGAVELADVLGEVPAIGVPGAVKLDSQRAGGDRLTRLHPIAGSPLAGQTCFAVCPIPLRALGGFGWNPTGAGSSPGGGCG